MKIIKLKQNTKMQLSFNNEININNKFIILFFILMIGIFLRVYDLNTESLWLDEGFSITYAKLNLYKIFFLRENNPPLYFIILHLWINLFGDSEFSVRFLSVLFGSSSIFMMYKVSKQIFDKDVGIFSSLLLCLSVFHIHYSQEARTYSLTVLLTLLSMYFFTKYLKKRSNTILFAYILSSTFLIYSHIYGIFIIISQNIYIISLFLLSKNTYKLKLISWILIQIILFIFFIPWASIFINQTLKIVHDGFWIPRPVLSSIEDSFIRYSGSTLLFSIFMILSILSILKVYKINKLNSKNIFKTVKNNRWKISFLDTDENFFLLVWLITPIFLPYIISQFSTPIYLTKYTIVASLAFYILISKGIKNISHKLLKFFVISVIILISVVNVKEYYTKIDKEQWRDVANYIETNAKNGDLLLFNAGIQNFIFNYYSKRTDLIKKPFPEKYEQVDEKNITELRPTVEGYKRVWLILSHSTDKKGLIIKKLIEAYNLTYQEKYVDIKIYVFERKE